jgi:hypothetical protein
MLILTLQIIAWTAVMAVVLLWPAGTLAYPGGWAFADEERASEELSEFSTPDRKIDRRSACHDYSRDQHRRRHDRHGIRIVAVGTAGRILPRAARSEWHAATLAGVQPQRHPIAAIEPNELFPRQKWFYSYSCIWTLRMYHYVCTLRALQAARRSAATPTATGE